VKTFAYLFFLLLLTTTVLFSIKKYSQHLVKDFPKLPASCESIKKEYASSSVDLNTIAKKEYLNYFLADKIGITSE